MNQRGLTSILIVLLIVVAIGGGYLLYQNQPKPITPPPQQTVQPTPSATDKTDNWEIYTNTQNNFSFRYPTGWNLKEEDIKRNKFTILLEVKSPDKQLDDYTKMPLYELSVATKYNKEKLTLDEEVNQTLEGSKSPGVILEERGKFKIDGKEAEKLRFAQDTGVENIVVITLEGNTVYVINSTANFITDNLSTQFENEFETTTDQILSTFKFQ